MGLASKRGLTVDCRNAPADCADTASCHLRQLDKALAGSLSYEHIQCLLEHTFEASAHVDVSASAGTAAPTGVPPAAPTSAPTDSPTSADTPSGEPHLAIPPDLQGYHGMRYTNSETGEQTRQTNAFALNLWRNTPPWLATEVPMLDSV